MIDFATLQGLTIPEGSVIQITDEIGNVLWEKRPTGATVTLTFAKNSLSNQSGMTNVIIGGVIYPIKNNSYSDDMTEKEIVVPIGTVITCKVLRGGTSYAKITLNGTTVATGVSEYEYTVTGDVTIHSTGTMSGPSAENGIININEL